METLRIIKHTMSVEYVCPTNDIKQSIKIENPQIKEGEYFEDWTYKYIELKCKHCGKTHKFEI